MFAGGLMARLARLAQAVRARRPWRAARARQAVPLKVSLTGAVFTDTFVELAGPTNVTLAHADLAGADLSDANLPDADLSRANLKGANLTDADLTRADLHASVQAASAIFLGAEYSERTRWPSELDAGIRVRSETISFGRWRVASEGPSEGKARP